MSLYIEKAKPGRETLLFPKLDAWDGRHMTFVCGLLGHPLVRRVKTQRLECYCGRIMQQIVEDVEESDGPLTAEVLRAQIRELYGEIAKRDLLLDEIVQLIRPGIDDEEYDE